MMYVYILSDYGEHGAEHVTATLDRSKLFELVDENWDDFDEIDERHRAHEGEEWRVRAKAGLAEVLKNSDEELCDDQFGHNCGTEWGGMQLHVVKLKGMPLPEPPDD